MIFIKCFRIFVIIIYSPGSNIEHQVYKGNIEKILKVTVGIFELKIFRTNSSIDHQLGNNIGTKMLYGFLSKFVRMFIFN